MPSPDPQRIDADGLEVEPYSPPWRRSHAERWAARTKATRWILRGSVTTVWRTRDREEIPIDEMTDRHLLNTINYLRRRAERREDRALLMLNGDGDFGGFEIDNSPTKPEDPFDELIAECRQRGGGLRWFAERVWDDIHIMGYGYAWVPWPQVFHQYRADWPSHVPYPVLVKAQEAT